MSLLLTKPLCVFDLETTGLQITKDRIVQIGIIKIEPNGNQIELSQLINPEIIIPEETIAIHGITNEKVSNEPTFREFAPTLTSFINDSDLAGYNSNKFDIPILAEELLRCGIEFNLGNRNFVDVQNIFHKMEQRTLAAAYQFYCNKEIKNAHDALYDTKATLEVLIAQTKRYEQLSKDIKGLAEFSRISTNEIVDFAGRLAKNEKGEIIYNFGKHKGKTLEQVMSQEPGYYGWMLEADFPLHTKQCLKEEMAKLKNVKSEENSISLEDKLSLLKNKFNSK